VPRRGSFFGFIRNFGRVPYRLAIKGLAALEVDRFLNAALETLVYRHRRDSLRPVERWRRRRFQVLVYHKVSSDPHPFFPPVPPCVFDQQLNILKHLYNVLPLQELVERSMNDDLPERAVAITFDDGYQDNYTYAFPILRKYELPATIFVSTAAIDNKVTLWHDQVFDAFRFARNKKAHLDRIDCEINLNEADTAWQSLNMVLRRAKYLPARSRIDFVNEVEQALNSDITAQPRANMLSWAEIEEMHRQGIRFGSHTVTHPILTQVDQQQLQWEITESKSELQKRLNMEVTAFAYPNGQARDYDESVKRALQQAGYQFAVTTKFGFNTFGQDPFELHRGQPWQEDADLFRLHFFLQRHGIIKN